MIKFHQLTVAILTVSAMSLPLHAADTSKKTEKPAAKPAMSAPTASAAPSAAGQAEASAKPIPFHGKIASVDKAAKTFTIESKKGEGRTFMVSDSVKPVKGEKEAPAWDALTVGKDVSGTYKKSADGKLEIVSLKVGAKEETGSTATESKPEKSTKMELKVSSEKKK